MIPFILLARKEGEIRELDEVAKVPDRGDNVAIATERLEAGTEIERGGVSLRLGPTVLEGHRFAAGPVAAGEALLSWGLPFGWALRAIAAGEYACNEKILRPLADRDVDFPLPPAPNFRDDELRAYWLDEASFVLGEQVPPHPEPASFLSYERPDGRGVGTRNYWN